MGTDKRLLKTRFGACLESYDSLASVQDGICGKLAEMIDRICPKVMGRVLEIGAGTGFMTRRIVGLFPDAQWFINDLVGESARYLDRYTTGCRKEYVWGDAETVSFPDALDLIVSASTVQWFDDLPRFFTRAADALNPNGHLAFSTFGPGNFAEIRATTGEGLDYFDRRETESALEAAGFAVIETLEYTVPRHFPTPADVLRHIRATGVNSLRQIRWTRRTLSDFETNYRRDFGMDDGRVVLTYRPVLIVAQKR